MSTDLDHSSSSFSSSSSSCYHVDDDYIDMEVSSSSNNLFCYSPQNREFEFQMSSICKDKDAATFPADELFYKGKLLPLHLPPRLQMVQKLLQNPPTTTTTTTTTTNTFYSKNETFQENYSIPFISFPTTTTTPLESCNISPSECCTVSCEINPDDYFFELSTEINSFIVHQTPKKKSWTKKLKQSLLLGKNLKASSAYLKYLSFFNKSGYGNESCAKAEPEVISKDNNNNNNNYMKVAKKNSSFANTLVKSIEKEMGSSEIFHSQRRSFSGAIQRHSTTNYKSLSSSSGSSSSSSSFSFSSSSNGFCDLQLLKRSNSVNSDIESSIEGAIAYCKKSHQQLFCSAKVTATEVL